MILTLGLLINCGGGGGGSTSNNSDPPAPTPVPPTPTTPTTPTTSTKFDKPFQMDGIVLRQQGSYHLPDTGMENVADPQNGLIQSSSVYTFRIRRDSSNSPEVSGVISNINDDNYDNDSQNFSGTVSLDSDGNHVVNFTPITNLNFDTVEQLSGKLEDVMYGCKDGPEDGYFQRMYFIAAVTDYNDSYLGYFGTFENISTSHTHLAGRGVAMNVDGKFYSVGDYWFGNLPVFLTGTISETDPPSGRIFHLAAQGLVKSSDTISSDCNINTLFLYNNPGILFMAGGTNDGQVTSGGGDMIINDIHYTNWGLIMRERILEN